MTEQNAIANYYKYTGKKTFNFTTALVDMDGVLFDSMKNHTRAWVKLMKKNGIKCTRDEFYMYEGMTGRDIIKMKFKDGAGKNITDDEAQALYKVKTRYFTELGDVEMIDGTLSLLKALKAAGIKCVLVTGSGTQSMLDRVDADYEGIFDEQRVTAADVKRGKPNPEPYLKAMAKVNAMADVKCLTSSGEYERLFDDYDIEALSVRRGTLTEAERKIIESHVSMTYKLLANMNFDGPYKNVPIWASEHHEYLDGSGYPNGLKGVELCWEVRLLTIIDIYDALTAEDRPYKPPLPPEKAFNILRDMAKEGKLDINILEDFIKSEAWK